MSKCWAVVRKGAGWMWRAAHRQKHLLGEGLETKMNRCLSTADLVLIGLGHMMGAGIYIITGEVMLHKAGASTLIAYMFGGMAAILGGLCYAQFSVNIPKTGTAYNYVYFIFGEVWGFLAGWNLVLEYLILVASVGRSLSAYIDSLTGDLLHNVTIQAFGEVKSPVFGDIDFLAAGLILVFFVIIAVGVRSTINVNNVMTTLNVVVLIIIAISSMVIGSVDNFNKENGGFFPMGWAGTFGATGVVFFAYVGFDAIAVASEETRNPDRSLPIAICVAIAIVTVLYCMASFSLSLLVPYNEVDPNTPFPSAFQRYNVKWVMYTVTFGALFGMIASLLGQAYCLPRGIYALANDGLLFTPLTYVNSWTQTPLVSIAISAIIASLLAMFIKISELVEMVSIGTLFSMTLMAGSLLKLHYLPVTHCPFELCIDGFRFYPQQDNAAEQEHKQEQEQEKHRLTTSATSSAKPKRGQTLANIGQPRFEIPYLNKMEANTATSAVIAVLIVAEVGVAVLAVRGAPLIAAGNAGVIFLLVVFLVMFIVATGVLLTYEHNISFAKFQVPFMPWWPIFTIFVNLTLMMVLDSATWIRLFVWIIVGLLIYLTYGVWHSTADRDTYMELEEPATLSVHGTPPTLTPPCDPNTNSLLESVGDVTSYGTEQQTNSLS